MGLLQSLVRPCPSLGTSSQVYEVLSPGGGAGSSAAAADWVGIPVAVAGTFRNLKVNLDTAPGGLTFRTVTLYKNGLATSLTFSITGTATAGQDIVNAVTYAVGDSIWLRFDLSGSPAASAGKWSVDFEAADNFTSQYGISNLNTGSGQYLDLFAGSDHSAQNQGEAVISQAGTITGLVGANYSNSLSALVALDVYLYKNGVKQDGTGGTVDTKLSITNVAAATAVVKSFSLSVSRGDVVYAETFLTGSPAGRMGVALSFVSSTAHRYMSMGGGNNLSSVTAYGRANRAAATWRTVNDSLTQYRSGVTPVWYGLMYAKAANAPGAGETRDIDLLSGTSVPTGTPAGQITNAVLTIDDTKWTQFVEDQTLGPIRNVPSASAGTTGRVLVAFVVTAVDPTVTPPIVFNPDDIPVGLVWVEAYLPD